jgi:hypothetical protein
MSSALERMIVEADGAEFNKKQLGRRRYDAYAVVTSAQKLT